MSRFAWFVGVALGLSVAFGGCSKEQPAKEPPSEAKEAVKKAEQPPAVPETNPAAVAPEKPGTESAVKPADKPADPSSAKADPAEPPALTAESLLDKAIAAAGGVDLLKEKLGSYSYSSTGLYFGAPYQMDTTWKAPDKMLMALEKGATVMGYVGKECWTRLGNVVLDCPKEELVAAGEMLTVATWTSLYSLKEGGVKLELAQPKEVEGKKLVGLKVTREDGTFNATLYFEEATFLAAGVVYDGHFMGNKGTIETWITEIKEFDGMRLPSKSYMLFAGKKIIEDNVQTMAFGVIDDAAFGRPETLVNVPGVRTLPEQMVATTTHKGAYQMLGMSIGMLYGWLGQNGITPMGVPAQVYLVDPSTEQDPAKYVTEIWIPVAKPEKEVAGGPNQTLKTVPAQEIAALAVIGPYEKSGEAYTKLKEWIAANAYEIAGPAGMFSYSNPMDTPVEKLVNEVYFPVKKKAQ